MNGSRNWSVEELRVIVAIFFNASFSIGDDARDECRAIADCFGRTPSSIDRQWRNIDAVVKGKMTYNIGSLVRKTASDYLANPVGSKELAQTICKNEGWPLLSLITEGTQQPLESANKSAQHIELSDRFRDLSNFLEFKLFSSGSQGFYCQGKIKLDDGTRYQSQVTAVLIGSKNDLTINMVTSREDIGFALIPVFKKLEAKTFKTGRTGFYASGKAQVGTERFQVGIQAIQIGET